MRFLSLYLHVSFGGVDRKEDGADEGTEAGSSNKITLDTN